MGCYSLLQRIFLAKGSNPDLLCHRCMLYWVDSLPPKPPGKSQVTHEIGLQLGFRVCFLCCLPLIQCLSSSVTACILYIFEHLRPAHSWGSICIWRNELYKVTDISFFKFFSFIFITWRLITLQHRSGFCHTLKWISHGFTCVPHSGPPSHLPLHPIPLGLRSAPGPST